MHARPSEGRVRSLPRVLAEWRKSICIFQKSSHFPSQIMNWVTAEVLTRGLDQSTIVAVLVVLNQRMHT